MFNQGICFEKFYFVQNVKKLHKKKNHTCGVPGQNDRPTKNSL